MNSQPKPQKTEKPKTRHDLAVEKADKRILDQIDAEITNIHPAYRQAAHTAIRYLSREMGLFTGDATEEEKEQRGKDLKRFMQLIMANDIQAQTIEKALRMTLRMYIMRRQEMERLEKGFSPRLLINRKEPEVKSRKRKKPELKIVR